MQRLLLPILSVFLFSFSAIAQEALKVAGLQAPVEVYRDPWGINHIYADNEHDLFFAQGYCAARDRLFQFEVWRRQVHGTVAEILGPRELKRDIGTRLFKFRGNMQQEMNHYHPRGEAIITAFVEGVNAYIGETEKNAELLPVEFELLGIKPGYWTPETVISRHQGLLGNIGQELQIGRAVALLGPDKVNELMNFHPGTPDLALDTAINAELLFDDILELYNAYRRPVRFQPEDIADTKWRAAADASETQQLIEDWERALAALEEEKESIGSNNWVVSGEHTQSGFPMMANDPHRTQAVPSLRYWVHLNAPGWNVIGGGEPEIPGVSIGHNDYGAWGLTVFRTDGEDLYVYDTHPDNPNQYRYDDRWEEMRVIQETIPVKGQEDVTVDLKYSPHGPVVYEDTVNHKAYAVRGAWQEIGGSPYLASLRMDQAKSWEEFREACNYSNIPGENMIWADKEGNIGWQAVGIAPIRRHWSGLVPVPGDGRYEWDGYLPIKAKPHVYNPESGIKATANEMQVPDGYPYRDAVGYSWSDSYRADRIAEVLNTGQKHSLMDMVRLQTDYFSVPARNLVPLLKGLTFNDRSTAEAQQRLLDWDYYLEPESVAAGIYVAWENRLKDNMHALMVPEKAQEVLTSLPMTKVVNWLVSPVPEMGNDPVAARDRLLVHSLEEAVARLQDRLGNDQDDWQYGQEDYKHILLRHPLSAAVNADMRARLNIGPYPRGGNSYTVGSTGGNDNQSSGASFRLIVDTSNWDRALGSNTPGQSGDPDSPYYRNLFEQWAQDRYFPVYFSKEKVQQAAQEVLRMEP
jgi:penicillin amidase